MQVDRQVSILRLHLYAYCRSYAKLRFTLKGKVFIRCV